MFIFKIYKCMVNEIKKLKKTKEEAISCNLNFSLSYINEISELQKEINKYTECDVIILYINDTHYVGGYVEIKNNNIPIIVSKINNHYKFSIDCNNFTNISKHTKDSCFKFFKKPQKCYSLNKENIEKWIVYLNSCYNSIKQINDSNTIRISKFLIGLNVENVKWKIPNKKGSIYKNGILYSFEFIDGIIEENYKNVGNNINMIFAEMK